MFCYTAAQMSFGTMISLRVVASALESFAREFSRSKLVTRRTSHELHARHALALTKIHGD